MIELLKILLSLSLSGALLVLVLILCKPFYRNRLNRQWQYYIWLVVIARLLLPFTPETSLIGNLFQGLDSTVIQTNTSGQMNYSMTPVTGSAKNDMPLNNQASTTIGEFSEQDKTVLQIIFDTLAQNIWLICVLIWLMVAVGLLIRKVTIYQSFVKYINAGRVEVTDMRVWEQLGKVVEQAGVKRTVELYTNSLITSPLLIGFLHPCIMLPSAELSDSDLEYTILHELVHYKRRDMFYKWLVQVTICFHWFNPFVYLMGKEINRACEFSCDEAVIRTLDREAQRAYGDTLLNALNQGGKYKDSLASVTLNENAKILKERLDAIMKFKKSTQLTTAISIVLVLVFCFGATAAGAYASKPFVDSKGNDMQLTEHKDFISPVTLNAKTEAVPLHIDNCEILYDDSPYHWPSNVISFTNTSDKAIMDYEIVCLAYDENGNPLELYWDARNVAANGEIGSVGFGPDGVDYGFVTNISPVSPKSYSHIYEGMQQQPPEDLIRSFEIENGKAWVENWLQEWKQSEEEYAYENAVVPGQSQQVAWPLFDGWDQSLGKHDVMYIAACIKQVTYDDGATWVNMAYGDWLKEHQGRLVPTDLLENYYN